MGDRRPYPTGNPGAPVNPAGTAPEATVELREIRKRYGSVVALDGADLLARPGEVHAVLGENGAGKTTLLRVLAGSVVPDTGAVLVDGAPARFSTPRDANARGIGMVHQHFTLVPALTIAENVALGVPWRGADALRLPLDRVAARIDALAAEAGLSVDPRRPVSELSVGARQRVEILKLLFRDPRVLVLDEPTAVLAPQEVTWLFGVLRSLAREGRTVLLVAHKLDEVLSVADRVTVLRNGATVLTARREEVQASDLARAMVGHAPGGTPSREGASPGAEVARLEAVEAPGPRGEVALREVSLAVRRGEIVGVAGVEGNGQRELALVLSGRIPPTSGRAHLPARVGFIPQDRGTEGLIGDFDLAENVALAVHDDPEFRRGPLLSWERIREEADAVMERFGVRAPGWQVAARSLSGGNQQKLVVGRELRGIPDLLVAENPTRGLDIGATEFVHAELVDLARGRLQGAAPPGIVLLSTDLEEVLALSDRLFVMVRGSLLPVPPEDRSPEGVGSLMLSGARQS